jgi:hypothetical protein
VKVVTMKKLGLSTVALTMMVPTFAMALDLGGAVTLGYGAGQMSGPISGNVSEATLDFRSTLAFDNNLTLGFDASVAHADDPATRHDDFNNTAARLTYQFGSGATVGAYIEHTNRGVFNDELTSYGVIGGYNERNYHILGFYGASNTDDRPGITIRDYGLSAGFAVNDHLTFAANVMRSALSNSGMLNGDYDLFDLAANYRINTQWAIFAGISHKAYNLPVVATSDAYGLGVSYALPAGSNVPAVLSLELAQDRISPSGGARTFKRNTIRVGVTFPLGKSETTTPLNSAAGKIETRRHSVYAMSDHFDY